MDEVVNSQSDEKEPIIVVEEAKTTVLTPTRNRSQIDAIQAIIEKKAIKVDTTKKRLLFNKQNLNEKDLGTILIKEDQIFYAEKKDLYLESYPELAEDPFDLDELHSMIMEQIFQRNLLRKKKIRPYTDIDKEFENSKKRENENKKNLSVRRTDRVKQKGEKKTQVNIAQLSVQFQDPDKMREFTERTLRLKEEELESGLLGPEKSFE